MNTDVREERLIITSDLHMGNALFPPNRDFIDLARLALRNGYNLCINGDGVEIIQMSFSRLTRQLGEAANIFRKYPDAGLKIYYTVGNHDLVLEHFLQDWGGVIVIPFINVESGERRIRVEHGHMYDNNFLAYPGIYTAMMVIGRWAISIHPRVYEHLEHVNQGIVNVGHFIKRVKGDDAEPELPDGIPGEHPSFRLAAEEISGRGFDAVVFGHTHRPGHVRLLSGGMYYNTGAWMHKPYCAVINHGDIWFGTVAELLRTGVDNVPYTQVMADAPLPVHEPARAGQAGADADAPAAATATVPVKMHRVG
jgi:UDP-2,3-diacylglucosamine pyrophosphatase LpxH